MTRFVIIGALVIFLFVSVFSIGALFLGILGSVLGFLLGNWWWILGIFIVMGALSTFLEEKNPKKHEEE